MPDSTARSISARDASIWSTAEAAQHDPHIAQRDALDVLHRQGAACQLEGVHGCAV